MDRSVTFCTVDTLDCSVSLRRTNFQADSYVLGPDRWMDGYELTKWQTVPPLLELTAEAMVVNNWTQLIELLLDQISSEPIYSSLLARALFHSKVQIVRNIFLKWRWKKMVFVDSPLLAYISLNHQAMISMILKVFTTSAMRGDLGVLRYIDISFFQDRLDVDIINKMKSLMGNIQVSERLYDPYLHSPGDKKKFVLYIHENLREVECFSAFNKDVMETHFEAEDYEIVIIPTSATISIDWNELDLLIGKNVNTLNVKLIMLWGEDFVFNLFNQFKLLQNICGIEFHCAPNCIYSTDDFFNELVSMQKGLKSISLHRLCESLLPEHLTKLALSNHVSTLEEIVFKYYNLDIVQSELFDLIGRCSGTLKHLRLRSFTKFSASFLRKLFTVLKTCKKLVVLVIEAVCEIDFLAREEAISLGGLPDFAMFELLVESADVAITLLLDRSMNEYRCSQLSSGFRRRIEVKYCKLRV